MRFVDSMESVDLEKELHLEEMVNLVDELLKTEETYAEQLEAFVKKLHEKNETKLEMSVLGMLKISKRIRNCTEKVKRAFLFPNLKMLIECFKLLGNCLPLNLEEVYLLYYSQYVESNLDTNTSNLAIIPIQRIPRYEMLLDKMIRQTSNSQILSALSSAAIRIKQVVRRMDEALEDKYSYDKLNTLLKEYPHLNVTPNVHSILYEDPSVYILNDNGAPFEENEVILITDQLLLLKSGKLKHRKCRKLSGSKRRGSNSDVSSFLLKPDTVLIDRKIKHGMHAFQLVNVSSTICFGCVESARKDAWANMIRAAILDLKQDSSGDSPNVSPPEERNGGRLSRSEPRMNRLRSSSHPLKRSSMIMHVKRSYAQKCKSGELLLTDNGMISVSSPRSRPLVVLLVEQDEGARTTLSQFFTQQGHHCLVADCAANALSISAKHGGDVDVLLCNSTENTLVTEFLDLYPNGFIILMTAESDGETAESGGETAEATSLGASATSPVVRVTKPIQLETLQTMLRRCSNRTPR